MSETLRKIFLEISNTLANSQIFVVSNWAWKGTINISPQGWNSPQYFYVQCSWSHQPAVQLSPESPPLVLPGGSTRSTLARYQCRIPDRGHQCPRGQYPQWGVWQFSVSCTQTLSCPSCHLIAVKETQTAWVMTYLMWHYKPDNCHLLGTMLKPYNFPKNNIASYNL